MRGQISSLLSVVGAGVRRAGEVGGEDAEVQVSGGVVEGGEHGAEGLVGGGVVHLDEPDEAGAEHGGGGGEEGGFEGGDGGEGGGEGCGEGFVHFNGVGGLGVGLVG